MCGKQLDYGSGKDVAYANLIFVEGVCRHDCAVPVGNGQNTVLRGCSVLSFTQVSEVLEVGKGCESERDQLLLLAG